MAYHIDLGNSGEQLARDYLVKMGFEIVAKNYRYKKAEIDIIAKKDKLLIFVEVKTRKSKLYGEPEQAVGKSKITLILSAAGNFIESINWLYDIRFDIIAIHYLNSVELTHIEDAFY